jgi:orotate phosphoribosyltransferase-like protein
MGKQYGHIILEKAVTLKEEGKTNREIGEELGYSKEQIKQLLARNRINERKLEAGIALKKKGRPRKGSIVTEESKIAELRYKITRKEYRIKQLEMENELLRDFLKETGRK